MSPPAHSRAVALLLLALVAGCTRKSDVRHLIGTVEADGKAVIESPLLALDAEKLRGLFVERLEQNGNFRTASSGVAEASAGLRLVLDYAQANRREGETQSFAELRLRLEIRPSATPLLRYEVDAGAEAPIKAETLEERRISMRVALDRAIDEALEKARVALTEIAKKDSELVVDLKSEDLRVRAYALQVLTNRKHPAVIELLVERLQSADLEEVRRALGGLVELKAVAAVPEIIELGRRREPYFLRELIYALGAIGGEEAEAYLFTVAQGHDQPMVQEAARQAMEELLAARTRANRPATAARGEEKRK